MYDKLLNNMLTAIRLVFPNGTQGSPAAVAYVRRKLAAMPMDHSEPKIGGNQRSKVRFGRAIAAIYDRQYRLGAAFYARDTSHWAAR